MSADDFFAQALLDEEIEAPQSRPPIRIGPNPGQWEPDLNPTQRVIFYDETEIILGFGEKGSGKSIGFLHKVVKHCYEQWNALVIIITPSIRTGQEGVGADLDTLILPQWAAGMGLEYRPGKMDPSTKDRHWWVGNQHGSWSKILLISIPYADAVQSRIKGPAPSMIYVDELTNCPTRDYFTYTHAQLNRRRGITCTQQWLASCNPEGPEHWVYKLFWEDCKEGSDACNRLVEDGFTLKFRSWPKDTAEPGISRDDRYGVYHVPFEENEGRLPKRYANSLRSNLSSDPIEYARLIEGKWIERPSGLAIFKSHYDDARHRAGDIKSSLGLAPADGVPIVLGFDLGSNNSCVSFLQASQSKLGDFWICFDEICVIDEKVDYRRITRAILMKLQYWSSIYGKPFSVLSISDNSAFNQFRSTTGSYDVMDIERFSREIITLAPEEFSLVDPIRMIECPKPPGSIEQRVRTVMDMLDKTDGFFLSAKCEFHREMFMQLESERVVAGGKFNPALPFTPRKTKRGHIHCFDSFSYPLYYFRLTNRSPTTGRQLAAVSYTNV